MKHVSWCDGRRHSLALWILLVFACLSPSVLAQNPILQFSFEGQALSISANGSAGLQLRIANDSVYDADDVEVVLLDGPATLSPIEPVSVVDAFSSTVLHLQLSADDDAAIGVYELHFEIAYTYCIGDLCFQIVEGIMAAMEIISAPITPIEDPVIEPSVVPSVDSPSPAINKYANLWRLLFPLGLGIGLAVALISSKVAGRKWWVLGLFLVVLGGGLGYGISLRQDQQAQSIGAVLCTSCVGIEETPHHAAELSTTGKARIEALTEEIELLLFSATWCHACPFAKAMVDQAVEANPLITIELIDVDADRDAADRHGIIQSGRTIVPAILRVDTDEVLFGIEDLEARLLALLEAQP